MRLVGGGFSNEGTVEVCFDSVWGQISDVGWTEGDAKVIYNQLGYSGGSKPLQKLIIIIIYSSEYYIIITAHYLINYYSCKTMHLLILFMEKTRRQFT